MFERTPSQWDNAVIVKSYNTQKGSSELGAGFVRLRDAFLSLLTLNYFTSGRKFSIESFQVMTIFILTLEKSHLYEDNFKNNIG